MCEVGWCPEDIEPGGDRSEDGEAGGVGGGGGTVGLFNMLSIRGIDGNLTQPVEVQTEHDKEKFKSNWGFNVTSIFCQFQTGIPNIAEKVEYFW